MDYYDSTSYNYFLPSLNLFICKTHYVLELFSYSGSKESII